MLQSCGNPRPVAAQRKAIGPLDNDYGGFGECVFEAQGLEIGESFDAVKVNVIDLYGRRDGIFHIFHIFHIGGGGTGGRSGASECGAMLKNMNERKRGAGDFVFLSPHRDR